jgi:hypothetical protein
MQKHTTSSLTGIFTGLALFAASGAQAQLPEAPQSQASHTLILTPLKGFDLKDTARQSFPGERSNNRPRDGLSLDLHLNSADAFGRPAEDDRFADRLRSGEILGGDLGRGKFSIRVKKGLSIRYKIQF